mmetsp:Transcript_18244/g.28886  ORF Transcript_18244/g.28886 Transcript_18244/m.28886 type:complete len:257 (+) Transcript_18244:1348-2118(+)
MHIEVFLFNALRQQLYTFHSHIVDWLREQKFNRLTGLFANALLVAIGQRNRVLDEFFGVIEMTAFTNKQQDTFHRTTRQNKSFEFSAFRFGSSIRMIDLCQFEKCFQKRLIRVEQRFLKLANFFVLLFELYGLFNGTNLIRRHYVNHETRKREHRQLTHLNISIRTQRRYQRQQRTVLIRILCHILRHVCNLQFDTSHTRFFAQFELCGGQLLHRTSGLRLLHVLRMLHVHIDILIIIIFIIIIFFVITVSSMIAL